MKYRFFDYYAIDIFSKYFLIVGTFAVDEVFLVRISSPLIEGPSDAIDRPLSIYDAVHLMHNVRDDLVSLH
ncbi:hypothetical protein C1930_08810 [Stenotrophomonas sp. SAU14A_NAIMI4_8]|nr:hypothetical protein C1930_08810 [Stenotrophomonas sp. SAU14A_NAIMI4_8]